MLRHLFAALVMSATLMVGLELTGGPSVPIDLLLGRMYWPPITHFGELPSLFAPIINLFPVLILLPFILLLAAGLLSLMEMD
jgi:hypothetical protein